MTSIDDLADEQHALPDPITAAEQLAVLLDLARVGLSIRGARIVGRGSKASADLYLSDGTSILFETLAVVANPSRLALEVAACCGATPRLKAPQAVQAVALLRALAEHQTVITEDQLSIEWGQTYLQAAETLEVDMSDQAQRWDAFARLERLDPFSRWRTEGVPIAQASLVLRDTSGDRLVRAGWFRNHVRNEDHLASPQQIAHRMERIGWSRPGGSGRIKATRPGLAGHLGWNFYVVPAAWQVDE